MRRASLEAELHRLGDAADEALWEVYGDALLEEGDPRGELVALALAEGRAKSKREARELAVRAAKVRARLDPIGHQAECDAILTDVEWTYGFLSAARVQEAGGACASARLHGGIAARLELLALPARLDARRDRRSPPPPARVTRALARQLARFGPDLEADPIRSLFAF